MPKMAWPEIDPLMLSQISFIGLLGDKFLPICKRYVQKKPYTEINYFDSHAGCYEEMYNLYPPA